jgi:transposase
MNKAEQRRELWHQLISQQETSGESIRAFCRGRGLKEHDFYGWRQRLRKQSAPVRFALVETKPAEQTVCTHRTDVGQRRPAADSSRCRDAEVGTGGTAGTDVIHLPASVRVYLCTSPCDMRRSFDGLHALVTGAMKLDAFAGHLFLFANRRKDRVKILYWDRDGFAVWAKRLEEGTYAMPFGEEQEHRLEITAQELGALLSGIDLSVAKRRKRYRRKSTEAA